MNLLTVLVVCVGLVALAWGALKCRSVAKDQDRSNDDRLMALWGARVLVIVFVIAALGAVQVSGIVKIPDPFQGPKVTNEMPNRVMESPATGPAPTLEGVPMQPDVGKAAREHQQQLKKFENRSQ
jgi:hypothetical protein